MANDLKLELERFGKRLKQLRKHRKLRLLDMEVLTGIQDSKISRFERGLENVEFSTLFKLSKGLQVSINALFDYDGPLPDNSTFKSPFHKSSKKKI